MNTKSFNKYFAALTSQHKYKETIETFHKMDSLNIAKSETIYANTMASYAQEGNL